MSGGLRRPAICLVTDRRRVSPPGNRGLLRVIEHAARAGVDLIQLREPSLDDGELFDVAGAALAAISSTAARLVVNERLDVALAARAHGVHLRADSAPADRVRAVAPPGFLIGRSVHNVEEAVGAARSGVDYLVAGTVYATPSKPPGPLLGLDGLASIAACVAVPVLGIGGVTAETAAELASTGAAGVAAIGLFADTTTRTDGQLDEELRNLVERIRESFRAADRR